MEYARGKSSSSRKEVQMKTVFYRISILIGIFVFVQLGAHSQNRMVVTVPSGSVLELQFGAKRPPARISLSREMNGLWTSNIERIANWSQPADVPRAQAVNFQASLVDGKIVLTVSVFHGTRFRENEDVIATFRLVEGESATINEVAKYGFKPIEMKAIHVDSSMANIPVVTNRTQSLSVEVAPTLATLPTFVARVKNNSGKDVIGFWIRTMAGNKLLVSAMPHALYGNILILAGKYYDTDVRADQPDASTNFITLYIDAVVFADGSYEGAAAHAANFKAFLYGRRDMLERVIPVLREAVAAAPRRPDTATMIARIAADQRPTSTDIVNAFMREFPNDHNLVIPKDQKPITDGRFIAAGDGVKNEIAGALKNLEKAGVGRSDEDVNKALAALTRHFQEWLDRIQIAIP